MGQQRYIWADSLKGILILLVVFGHAIQGVYGEEVESNRIWNIIYSFHMPAFFAISGYFVKPVFWGGKLLLKRVQQLLIPYFIWAFLKLALNQSFSLSSITGIILNPVSFWFLWVLFWVYLLFQLSLYVSGLVKTKYNYASISLAVLLIMVMAVFNTKIFGFHLISYYFAFYVLGYYVGQHHVLKIASKPILGILSVIWFLLALGWSMHSLPSWMPSIPVLPVSLLQLSYRFFTAVIAIIVLLNLAPILLNSEGNLNNKTSQLGYYSLGIYVTHYLIIWYIADWICKRVQIGNTVAEALVVFMLALFSSVILVWLLNRTHFTSKVFLGKIDRR